MRTFAPLQTRTNRIGGKISQGLRPPTSGLARAGGTRRGGAAAADKSKRTTGGWHKIGKIWQIFLQIKLINNQLFLQIFGGLVLGCIKTKFCKKICVWQHFASSSRCAHFCTAWYNNPWPKTATASPNKTFEMNPNVSNENWWRLFETSRRNTSMKYQWYLFFLFSAQRAVACRLMLFTSACTSSHSGTWAQQLNDSHV